MSGIAENRSVSCPVEKPQEFIAALVAAMRTKAPNNKGQLRNQLLVGAELIALTHGLESHTEASYNQELKREAELKSKRLPNSAASVASTCTNLEERYDQDAKAFILPTAAKAQHGKEEKTKKKGELKTNASSPTKTAKIKITATRNERARSRAPATYVGSLVELAHSLVGLRFPDRENTYFEGVETDDGILNDSAFGILVLAWAAGDAEIAGVASSPLGRTVMDFILAEMATSWDIPNDLRNLQNGVFCVRAIVVRSNDTVPQRVLSSLRDILNFEPTDGVKFSQTLTSMQMAVDAFEAASLSSTIGADMPAMVIVSEILKIKMLRLADQDVALKIMLQSKLRDIPPLSAGLVARLVSELPTFGDAAKVVLSAIPNTGSEISRSTSGGGKTALEVFQQEMIRFVKLNKNPSEFGKVFKHSWTKAFGDVRYGGLLEWMDKKLEPTPERRVGAVECASIPTADGKGSAWISSTSER
jgi:hypothetical protein